MSNFTEIIKIVKDNLTKGNGAVIRTSAIGKENEIIDATLNTFKGIINKSHLPSRVSFQAELKKR